MYIRCNCKYYCKMIDIPGNPYKMFGIPELHKKNYKAVPYALYSKKTLYQDVFFFRQSFFRSCTLRKNMLILFGLKYMYIPIHGYLSIILQQYLHYLHLIFALTCVLCNRHPFSLMAIFRILLSRKQKNAFLVKNKNKKFFFSMIVVLYIWTSKLAKSKNPPS